MWDTISMAIALICAVLAAWFIWRLQNDSEGVDLAKKLSLSLALGLLLGLIIFKAINPDSQIISISVNIQSESSNKNEGLADDIAQVKRANGTLRFFQEEPCN